MNELWKPVPDYDGYQVSNFGRVKRIYKNGKQRVLKPVLNRNGYLRICLSKGNEKKIFSIHRLVAQAFIPNPLSKPQINHIDGNKLNNHVENLEWVTGSENQRHAVGTGLKKSGQDRPEAKLTNQQAQYIRENPSKYNISQLAQMFSVKRTVIEFVQLGKTYKHAGGSIRQSKCPRLPDEVRKQIRAEYVFGSSEFGSYGLAKKYGVTHQTILNIIHEAQS